MRELTDHKVNGLNEALQILVLDEPGQGNACHEYSITLQPVPQAAPTLPSEDKRVTRISFQNGPIKDAGVNGISNEALLAVVIDRLRGFQAGEFATRENSLALTKLEEANLWLQKRTRDRIARGVEGTNLK